MPAPALALAPRPVTLRIRRHIGDVPLPDGESLRVWRGPGCVLVEHHTRDGVEWATLVRLCETADRLSRPAYPLALGGVR